MKNANTNLRRAILLILLAVLLIVEAIFVWQNNAEVPVKLMFWEGYSYTGLLIFISISIGILTAVILLLPGIVQRKKELREMNKQMKSLEEKLAAIEKETITENQTNPIRKMERTK